MTPAVPAVLAELAGLLVRNAEPEVPPADRAGALGLSAALLAIAAEVWDGMADRLAEENRALRALLARDPAVAERAGEAGASLRISALKAENDRLREALIELHVAAEARGDADLIEAIWAELVASTERRRLMASPV